MSDSLRRMLGVVLGCAACAGSTPAPPSPSTPPAPAWPAGATDAIRNVRVFDGERLLPAQTVLLYGERIASLGPDREAPAGVPGIDGTGKTLLPGLIDSHVHVWFADHLRQAAVFGVTTVLDMMDQPAGDVPLKKEADGDHRLADLRIAGYAATAPHGHGTEYGFVVPTLTEPAEAQAFVDARIAEGSDYIKIVYDDVRAFGFEMPTLSRATLGALVQAAHTRGRMALVHIGSRQGALEAIEAGADGLAHVFEDVAPDDEVGRAAASHRTFVVPTLEVSMSAAGSSGGGELIRDPELSPFLSPEAIAGLEQSFPHRPAATVRYAYAEETVRALKGAGVPLLAGTDAPNPGTTHGASLHGEVELLVKAGLTPSEALASATSVPARIFHLDDRGRIRPGLRADLLLVDGDPTADIRALRRISGVWIRGARLDRDAYRAEVTAKREEAARAASAASPAIEAGLISDFDDLSPGSRFGQGWSASTDVIAGGKSTASVKAIARGARRTRGSLLVSGEVVGGLPYAWAGTMFWPGSAPMEPMSLASKRGLSFWAKADGKTYRVLVFTRSRGRVPAVQTFTAPGKWKEFHFAFADFEGTDGHDVTGIGIVAGPAPGSFRIQLDEVKLE